MFETQAHSDNHTIPPFYSADHFFPSIGGGVPLFHHYQHLPHIVAAALGRLFSNIYGHWPYGAETDLFALMALCAMPVIIYFSLKRLQYSKNASALACCL